MWIVLKKQKKTKKYKKTNGLCDLICKGFLDSLEVKGREHTVSLGKKPLYCFIHPEYLLLEFLTLEASNDKEMEPMQHELLQASELVMIDIHEKVMGEESEDNSMDTAPSKKEQQKLNKKQNEERGNFLRLFQSQVKAGSKLRPNQHNKNFHYGHGMVENMAESNSRFGTIFPTAHC